MRLLESSPEGKLLFPDLVLRGLLSRSFQRFDFDGERMGPLQHGCREVLGTLVRGLVRQKSFQVVKSDEIKCHQTLKQAKLPSALWTVAAFQDIFCCSSLLPLDTGSWEIH